MTNAQKEHWELVMEIDARGRRLTAEEIDFIAGLIDEDREGNMTISEMNTVRSLHRRRVPD